ncbi:Uncharacterised protein [Vibrio cholerae]|nr:Uncharacterised protein [Vibrio cholerae]
MAACWAHLSGHSRGGRSGLDERGMPPPRSLSAARAGGGRRTEV